MVETTSSPVLLEHIAGLKACRLCASMHPPPVAGRPVQSKVLLVGQAPGVKEPQLQRPFAWTAGKTLFKWFYESCGLEEDSFRSQIYMSAVCRCFPGKNKKGGDRVPDREEIGNCSQWLQREFEILQPELVIPVGKLAIQQFMKYESLDRHVGIQIRADYRGHACDFIPLPHPSGASPWPRTHPGKTLLARALQLISEHPAFRRIIGD